MKQKPFFYIIAAIGLIIYAYVIAWPFYAYAFFDYWTSGDNCGFVRVPFTFDGLFHLFVFGVIATIVFFPFFTYLKSLYKTDKLEARKILHLPAFDFSRLWMRIFFYPLSLIYFLLTLFVYPFLVAHIDRYPNSFGDMQSYYESEGPAVLSNICSEAGGHVYDLHPRGEIIDPESARLAAFLYFFGIMFLYVVVYFIIYRIRKEDSETT